MPAPESLADRYDLSRFLEAQQDSYDQALSEIASGRKRTHWMWFIFPQLDGLAYSPTSRRYAIKSLDEAKAYLDHPVLGPRLLACAHAALAVEGRSALDIFGRPDDQKLRSSATLFAVVRPGAVFDAILVKYFGGARDGKTVSLLGLEG
jgi:uncharacterized protein (DUF1810 family)